MRQLYCRLLLFLWRSLIFVAETNRAVGEARPGTRATPVFRKY